MVADIVTVIRQLIMDHFGSDMSTHTSPKSNTMAIMSRKKGGQTLVGIINFVENKVIIEHPQSSLKSLLHQEFDLSDPKSFDDITQFISILIQNA